MILFIGGLSNFGITAPNNNPILDISKYRLLEANEGCSGSFLLNSSFNLVFRSSVTSCNPPRGHNLRHQTPGKNRCIDRRRRNPKNDIMAMIFILPEKIVKNPLNMAIGSNTIKRGSPTTADTRERIASHFPTSGKRLYLNDLR